MVATCETTGAGAGLATGLGLGMGSAKTVDAPRRTVAAATMNVEENMMGGNVMAVAVESTGRLQSVERWFRSWQRCPRRDLED